MKEPLKNRKGRLFISSPRKVGNEPLFFEFLNNKDLIPKERIFMRDNQAKDCLWVKARVISHHLPTSNYDCGYYPNHFWATIEEILQEECEITVSDGGELISDFAFQLPNKVVGRFLKFK